MVQIQPAWICVTKINHIFAVIIPLTQRSCWGVYWFHSVCLSVRPSVCPSVRPASRVRSVAPSDLVGSISYSYNLSSNYRRCVACKDSCKILKFEFIAFFFQISNFDFVFFWLGIWKLVWVIKGLSQNAGVLVVLVYTELVLYPISCC